MNDSPEIPNHQPINAIPPETKTNQENQEPPIGMPGPQLPPPPKSNKKTETCRPDQTPWWKHLFELAALLIGGALAIIYNHQLGVMGEQLTEMKTSGGQTDKLICLYRQQVAQLGEQVTAAKKQSRAVLEQLALQRQIARLNAGAKVAIVGIPFFHQGNKTVSIGFVLNNIGTKDATKIKVCYEISGRRPLMTMWDQNKCKHFEYARVVKLPIFNNPYNTADVGRGPWKPIPHSQFSYIYIMTTIVYTDNLTGLRVDDEVSCKAIKAETVFQSESGGAGHGGYSSPPELLDCSSVKDDPHSPNR